MKLTAFLLVLSALSVLPSTQAWTLVWQDASGNSYVEHNDTGVSCTKIRHEQGRRFEWDAEEGPFAISLYTNGDCSGRPAGYADHFWDHNATKALDSFKVDSTAMTTSSASMTTSTTTTASSPDTTSQSQASPTTTGAPSSPSGSGLSGGAIAGVVIGVIAGVTLIAGALYLIVRRKPPGAGNAGVNVGYPHATDASPSSFGPGLVSLESKNQVSSSGPGSAAHSPVRMVELQGNSPAVELSNNHAVNELEGRPGSQPVVSP